MQLAKKILKHLNSSLVSKPEPAVLQLPEKVLQFGTGVLLRGLPDYYIDRANKAGIFNGRIVVVKSTTEGDTDVYAKQDGLYTQCLKGMAGEEPVVEYIINASISRVVSAATEWQHVLDCATNPAMEIVISNTTEAGLVLHSGDKITGTPPVSFPGKLLAFLHHRYLFFKGSADKGMVILPVELLSHNGDKLKQIVRQLAKENELDEAFLQWLDSANHFCNTLVDRIVPGRLPAEQEKETEALLGYEDGLMIMSETYGLWAIETTVDAIIQKLSFADAAKGCVITDNIHAYQELKIRLLNGTHTFSCGVAILAGFTTVKEAMRDELFAEYTAQIMQEEIVPSIISDTISEEAALRFAASVLNRFSNPYIEHNWTGITLNYTQKMRHRCIPLLMTHYSRSTDVPERMALGFAAYLLCMQSHVKGDGRFYGAYKGGTFLLQDEKAAFFYDCWQLSSSTMHLVEMVFGNTSLWGTNLAAMPGFARTMATYIDAIEKGSIVRILKKQTRMVQK